MSLLQLSSRVAERVSDSMTRFMSLRYILYAGVDDEPTILHSLDSHTFFASTRLSVSLLFPCSLVQHLLSPTASLSTSSGTVSLVIYSQPRSLFRFNERDECRRGREGEVAGREGKGSGECMCDQQRFRIRRTSSHLIANPCFTHAARFVMKSIVMQACVHV